MTFNLVAAGVGGQGLVVFSEVLTRAMLRENLNPSFYVHSGLSQLGGSVRSHIRSGERVCPKISAGCADMVASLEMAEILHTVAYLKKEGTALVASDRIIPHHSRLRPEAYPSREAVAALLKEAAARVIFVPAGEIAEKVGSPLSLNMVMLGAVVGISRIVDTESIVVTVREMTPRNGDLNVEAFWKGYEFIRGVDYE